MLQWDLTVLVTALHRPVAGEKGKIKRQHAEMEGEQEVIQEQGTGRKGQEVYMAGSPCAARGP